MTSSSTNLPSDFLPKLPACYDTSRKDYYIQDVQAGWIPVSEGSLRRHLRAYGISPEYAEGELISPLECELNRIQKECHVAYAGPLAGYEHGLHELCGQRILVTASLKLIQPTPGEFPLLARLLENLFTEESLDQRPYVFGWLKVAYESLRAGRRRPGQVLAIAGVGGCGKSLFQNIITEILGGRSAKPFRYMSGATDFNGDLFGAEHLMIEDECASTSNANRRNFGTRIKDFTVNEVQSCHGKGRTAISLKPFWRVSVTLNDEPENILILPPIDDSLADKIILLKAHKKEMAMRTETLDEREQFWNALVAELPAFCQFLVQWEIPPELRCGRFGVTHFHHPELLEALEALSPERKLMTLIDAVLFHEASDTFWTGTAEELERELIDSKSGYEARRLLDWNNAIGTYLGRLASKYPSRFERKRTRENRRWIIRSEKCDTRDAHFSPR